MKYFSVNSSPFTIFSGKQTIKRPWLSKDPWTSVFLQMQMKTGLLVCAAHAHFVSYTTGLFLESTDRRTDLLLTVQGTVWENTSWIMERTVDVLQKAIEGRGLPHFRVGAIQRWTLVVHSSDSMTQYSHTHTSVHPNISLKKTSHLNFFTLFYYYFNQF